MKQLFLLFSLIFVFLVAHSFAADSPLVEAAKKEKERRAQLNSPARVLTNQDIEKFKEKNQNAKDALAKNVYESKLKSIL